MTTHDTPSFVHDPQMRQFRLSVKDKNEDATQASGQTMYVASIDYEVRDDVMSLTYSHVPPQLRGQGVGNELVRQTYAYLRKHRIEVIPVCSFIRKVAQREGL